MNKNWKTIFFIFLIISLLTYGLLIPPILADTPPNIFYRQLFSSGNNYNLEPGLDQDRDGLSDAVENEIGTSLLLSDTDNDGLSDYEEIQKYLTNPLNADSDGDEITDAEWAERREYTRTYNAVVDLRLPYSLEDMNDFYQDAKLLGKISDEVSRFEIVLYPDAEELLNPSEYIPKENIYTQTTFAKNYNALMQHELRTKVTDSKTDLQALQKLQDIFNEFEHVNLHKGYGYSTDLPLQFQYYMNPQGIIEATWQGYPTIFSMDELLNHFFFAEGMYYNRTRGACSSSATMRGALFRAAGLEEQTIFTIPLFYSLKSDQTVFKVNNIQVKNYSNQSDNSYNVADHFFNIVRIGNRWIRVDTGIIDTGLLGPYIKLLNTHDQAYESWIFWNYQTYKEKRPYRYISVIELAPVH